MSKINRTTIDSRKELRFLILMSEPQQHCSFCAKMDKRDRHIAHGSLHIYYHNVNGITGIIFFIVRQFPAYLVLLTEKYVRTDRNNNIFCVSWKMRTISTKIQTRKLNEKQKQIARERG